MNRRENYLIAAHGGRPDWVPCYPADCNSYFPEFWTRIDPETETDFCNVRWVENEYGRMPDERWRAMTDISQWRDIVKFPDLSAIDWEAEREKYFAVRDPEKVDVCRLNTHGIFLIPINMMGWVDGLISIYTDREELQSFVNAITDFLVELADYECRYFHPDIVFTGDDVAAANGPLISREVWSEIYKPNFKRIIDKIHSYKALAEFHCCGNCGFFIEEFLDVGADICQLPVPNEELKRDKERFGNRLVINGGWDRKSRAAMVGASQEEVRESVHTALDEWARDGALIFWDGGIAGQGEDAVQKREWLYDEFEKCRYQFYEKCERRYLYAKDTFSDNRVGPHGGIS